MLWVCRGSSSEWKNHKLLFVRPQLQPPSLKAGNGEDIFSMRNRADEACFPLDYFFLTLAPPLHVSPSPLCQVLGCFTSFWYLWVPPSQPPVPPAHWGQAGRAAPTRSHASGLPGRELAPTLPLVFTKPSRT